MKSPNRVAAIGGLDSPDDGRMRTFPLMRLGALGDDRPEPRSFVLDRYIPQRETTLFTGPGGAGKSIFAQQLVTALAAGLSFLGQATIGCSALYVTAEDDERELHWRQYHIARRLGVDLDVHGLHLASIRGEMGNALCTFEADGQLTPTPAFGILRDTIFATDVGFVALDNVAHLFPGNENDRAQVTAFVNLLNRLCKETGCAILLIAHPNKHGDTYSGSTAWLNAVRSQIVLDWPRDANNQIEDLDARELKLGKANYARTGDSLLMRWHEWSLIGDSETSGDYSRQLAAMAAAHADDAAFLACLRERTRQRRAVSEKASRTFAPIVFEAMVEAKGISRKRLEAAMDRLFRAGQIERAELWKGDDRKPVFGLRETAGNAAGNSAETLRGNCGEPLAETAGNTHSPPKGGGGAALEARADPLPDDIGDPRTWGTDDFGV